MNCDEVHQHLLDFVYRELPEDKRSALENHCEQCVDCRQQLKSMQRLHGALEKAANHEAASTNEPVSVAQVMKV